MHCYFWKWTLILYGFLLKAILISYLVLFEERSADITIQRVCKVILQVFQPNGQVVRFVSVVNGHVEEIDEPGE